MDLDAWFDRLPRRELVVGTRRVPVFRSLGIVGFHIALLTAVLAALSNGTPPLTAVGLSAIAGLSFFAWGVGRRAVTGRETLVLIEYIWAAAAAVALFLWATGGPVVPALDVFTVALTPFLAFGRLGCLTVGCCHGVPAGFGIRYPPGHHLPDRLIGRRLLPVPLFEAVALVVLGVVGFALLGVATGAATVWFLLAYAVTRFGLERLRGDHRPTVAGVNVAQLTCCAEAVAGLVAAEAWLVAGPPGRAAGVGAVAVAAAAVCGLGLQRSQSRRSLASDAHLDETWACIHDLAADATPGEPPLSDHTTRGMLVAVSRTGSGLLHVSLSSPGRSVLDVGLGLARDGVDERGAITHLVLPDPAPDPPVATSSYFIGPGARWVV